RSARPGSVCAALARGGTAGPPGWWVSLVAQPRAGHGTGALGLLSPPRGGCIHTRRRNQPSAPRLVPRSDRGSTLSEQTRVGETAGAVRPCGQTDPPSANQDPARAARLFARGAALRGIAASRGRIRASPPVPDPADQAEGTLLLTGGRRPGADALRLGVPAVDAAHGEEDPEAEVEVVVEPARRVERRREALLGGLA